MAYISIIGGGITGLSTALALQKRGLPFRVYERAPVVEELGAGIWMQPNALKVLDWLGVGAAVRRAGRPLDQIQLTDSGLRPVRRSRARESAPNRQIISLHRGRLQRILFEALPADRINLGFAYQAHRVEDSTVQIRFENGKRAASDLLLGCDGIHSAVRRQLFPHSALRPSGQTCWRGVAKADLPEELRIVGTEAWGQQGRFGFAPMSPGEVYWFAVTRTTRAEADPPDSRRERLLERFERFHPWIRDLIAQTPPGAIIRGDLSDLRRLDAWHQHRVCLLGDAAHAMTPNLGQGGCQGVEDAYYISRWLKRDADCRNAFAGFERERRPKVDYVVNASWRMGQMAHHSLGKQIARLALKWSPEYLLQRQMDRVFAVEGLP